MENPFARIMRARTDADLLKIAQEKHRYEPEAYIAAVEELERRQLSTEVMVDEKVSTIESLKETGQDAPKERSTVSRPAWKEALALFKISSDYFYTPIIVYLNVSIWLLMVVTGVNVFEPSVESLINWGGNLSALTLSGQPWRLLTSTFLHGGVVHLLFNMYTLLQAGALLETHFGKHRYAVVYIATGIVASVCSAALSGNVVSVGASGAIFGLYGLLVSLLITKSVKIEPDARQALLTSTLIFIGYNLLYGFAKTGIDNAAHIGGLASGFIIGFVYYPVIGEERKSSIVSMALVSTVMIMALLVPYVVSNPYARYNSVIETFGNKETAAMWMYNSSFPVSGTDEAKRFHERLKTEGIDLWKQNLALLNTLENMPSALQERVDLLKKYSELRIESCEIMQLLVASGGAEHVEHIEKVNKQIDEVISSLEALNK
jgi:rhomboid protease GluP